jgi:hypothetical protein
MYKASEVNYNPTDNDLNAFIDYLKASSNPKEKMLAEKGIEDRENGIENQVIYNMAKENNLKKKKSEKLSRLRNDELMMKSSVTA